MTKEFDGMTVNFNISFDSLNIQFGDTHSTTLYNTDMDEEMEMEFEDNGEDEEETEAEDACDCDCCKDEKKPAEDKHKAEATEHEKDLFKHLIESILADMK